MDLPACIFIQFYSRGVKSVDDVQFKDKFEDTFTAPSLQVPWYICAGNHDYYGGQAGIDAEIQYTNKSKRWNFDDYYFSKDLTMKDGTTMTILSVDTWAINGGDTYVAHDPVTKQMRLRSRAQIDRDFASGLMRNDTREVLLANFKEDDLRSPLQVGVDQKQLDWIAATLKASTADWKFVLGHFPVHSITTGEHGDTAGLIKQLQPILEAGGADGYWSGHDHILQHIIVNNMHYFGSGAGAMKHTGVNTKYPGLTGACAQVTGGAALRGVVHCRRACLAQPGAAWRSLAQPGAAWRSLA
jgi:hypothetical protein